MKRNLFLAVLEAWEVQSGRAACVGAFLLYCNKVEGGKDQIGLNLLL
jgi:hypothetical protein